MPQHNTFFPVAYLSALSFSGADAAQFLQGQLSADAEGLAAGEWLRAAYCSPKGRALATMMLARYDGGFAALLPADCADDVAGRLARFVLRAKVKIRRLPDAVFARLAPDSSPLHFSGGAVRHENGALIFDEGGGACLRLLLDSDADGENGGAGENRGAGENQLAGENQTSDENQTATAGENGDGAAWRLEQIRRGIPWVGAVTGDMFVPQYFNWDLLGGINFQKGCYVGQEIIARLHYLGNVKRRGYALFGAGAPPAEGAKIGGAEYSCQIINAVAAENGFAAFVSAPRPPGGEMELRWENRAARLAEPPYGLPPAAGKT